MNINTKTPATEGADLLKDSYAAAIRSVEEYNNKLLEYAQENTKATFDFFQQLSGVKSPTAFIELSTEHARNQFARFTEQTKQLTSLAQSATHAAAEPIKTGVAKAFEHVA